jgi:hypothetical protein
VIKMRCAVIKISTGIVDNVIVADPGVDKVSEEFLLVGPIPEFVEPGTEWKDGKFIDAKFIVAASDASKSNSDLEML